jgi:hypothetical protein
MIKDILVNLSYGTSQDGVSNYALSVAETFGAHIMGTAFAYYPVMASGFDMSANFIRAQQAEAQERAESVATAFDEATRRAGVSAETRRIEAGIGDVPTQFAHIARRFDLSVIGQFERDRDHPTRISSLKRRCSNPEDRCSSFLLFRKIASNSIMSWCAGMAAGQPRERSPMPCRFLPAPARRVLLLRTLRAPKAQTFRVPISRPI